MFTNLLTAKVVNRSEITKPKRIIPPTMMPIFTNSDIDTISGIAPLNAYSEPPNSRLAQNPAQKPCFAAVPNGGRMIYHFVAPTNLKVLIR